MRQGQLVYVMGASGSGKDSLLQALRPRLRGVPVAFARRYITRPLSAKGERHIAVSPERFEAMAASGEFVMDWRSHGLRYGIGKGVETTLAHGGMVLMNGSREYLPEALRRFPSLVPVLVEVDASVLRARLLARGREPGGDIEERIARASMPAEYPDGVLRIDNSGELAESTAAFYRMVARLIEEKTDFRQDNGSGILSRQFILLPNGKGSGSFLFSCIKRKPPARREVPKSLQLCICYKNSF